MQKSLTARINNILSYRLQLLHNEEHIKGILKIVLTYIFSTRHEGCFFSI
jgi:hypothetical protein